MDKLENYTQEELTINTGKAQLGAVIYFIPFLVLFGIPFFLLWDSTANLKSYSDFQENWGVTSLLIILGVVGLGVIIHELIHGFTWALFAKDGLKSIRYGVIWKWLTPYCHCKEPLKIKHYIIGALMPGIVLGILPCIVAIATGNMLLLVWGLFFIMAAGGDFMIVNLLRKQPLSNLAQDHPSKIGCYIYKPII